MKLLIACLLIASAASLARADLPLKVPTGFVVTEVCGPELANDIYGIQIDAKGRLVAYGRGYVRQILDAKRSVELVAGMTGGPMGLLWEDETLWVVVDGGLKKYTNVTGHWPAKNPQTVLKIKTGGEHDAHAVRRGPDGKLYLLCGNNAGVNAKLITSPNSPIKDPVAGALLRLDDDGGNVEVLSHGFRNAYDFDFNLDGMPYTFDSDNERCVGLPWYEHTRFYQCLPGSHAGWLNPQHAQTWRLPSYYADVNRPVATVGRGSPTGCICYRHTGFPEKYRDGFFLADWTFGKIWFVAQPARSAELFLEPTGESGFAPTGLAVHPETGDLYVSIGGRGTRGGIYRISPMERNPNAKPIPMTMKPAKAAPKLPKPDSMDIRTDDMNSIRSWMVEFGDLVDPKLVGTVWEGYSFRKPVPAELAAKMLPPLRASLSSGTATMNREVTRMLAALQDPDPATVARVSSWLSSESKPIDDVHYLIVLSRLTGERTVVDRARIADALVRLDSKFVNAKIDRDRHWPVRVSEATGALLKLDPKLEATLLAHTDFGQAHHDWLAKLLDQPRAARRILERSKVDKAFEWSPGIVELLGSLDESTIREVLPALVKQGGLLDSIIPLVAKSNLAEDRKLFVEALKSFQSRTLKRAAMALVAYPADESELLPTLQALRRLGDTKDDADAKAALAKLLRKQTGQELTTAKDWTEWLTRAKPAIAKQLASGGFDSAAWAKRAAAIDWAAGDSDKGRLVFAKAQCAACHNGAQAIGPTLDGVTKRFGRDDLLTAIVDPNRDVSPRYRTTEVQTRDGKSYRGVIIYEAVDGVILHSGTTDTVRIAGDNIESKRSRETSIMPVGLLDSLTNGDVADLIAYLKTLNPK
jgi:putative heme-binding domain-containing protein